jgi:hypothetical protein
MIHVIRLVVLATVAVVLVPICNAVIQLAMLELVFEFLALYTLSINHRSASATNPPAVAGLLLEGYIIWWGAKPDPRVATGLDLLVYALYSHGISIFIRHRSRGCGQL